MLITRLFFALAIAISGSVSTLSSASTEAALDFSPAQSETIKDIVHKLRSKHYRDRKVDDELSKAFLENYLQTLDSSRMFFYQEDIDQFLKHETKFDDDFKAGKLDPGFAIFRLYRGRVVSRLESIVNLLEDPSVKFDFEQKDSIELDRKEANWPSSRTEADELWYKRIKLGLLNLKLAGKPLREGRKTLAKRYKNQLTRAKQQDSADVFETIANSLTLLYDPHTNYWSPRTSENFDINMSLSLEGIGAVLRSEDEFVKVVELVPGGPAHKQGQLKPADKIIAVAQGDKGELVDVVGWRLDEVVQLIRGPKNTVVKLEVIPSGSSINDTHETISINRGKVKLEDAAAEKAVFDLPDGDKIYKIGVINLPTFYVDFQSKSMRDPSFRSASRDVSRLIDELQKESVDGIILDLRNNGGGSLDEAQSLTGYFIDRGPVVQIRTAEGHVRRHIRSHFKAKYRGPLIVMVNRLSASASEIFAGAIQDYNRGLIVGSQSFGKGTVQSVTPLLEGRIKLTESKFYRVSGESTQHRGVIPDIAFPFLTDIEEIGESSYDNALPWDQIHSVNHAKYFDLKTLIPVLDNLHKKRVNEDPDFNYIIDQMSLMSKAKAKKEISLNEKARIEEKNQMELEAMQIDNRRRVAKNMKAYKTLEDYRKNELDKEEDEDEVEVETETRKKIDVDGDTLLLETGNILVDYIRLTNKPEFKQAASF